MGSTMTVVEAVLSNLFLGFLLYELLHKVFKLPQLPGNNSALAMIFLYGMLFMFVISGLVYTPEKGGIFSRLIGYHAIPFHIIVPLFLVALFILYWQGEISLTVLLITGGLILWLSYQAISEQREYHQATLANVPIPLASPNVKEFLGTGVSDVPELVRTKGKQDF